MEETIGYVDTSPSPNYYNISLIHIVIDPYKHFWKGGYAKSDTKPSIWISHVNS